MHLKQEERCPIKSKSHLQKFVLHLSVSVWHANASHFCFRFFTLCYSSLTLRELWHLAFPKLFFGRCHFFRAFDRKSMLSCHGPFCLSKKRLQPWFDLCTNGKVFYEGISVTEVWTWNKKNGFSWNVPCLKKRKNNTFNLSNLDKKSML